MKGATLLLKVAILDEEIRRANLLKAIIETKSDVERVMIFEDIRSISNSFERDSFNVLFIDIFSIGIDLGTDFIRHIRTHYPVVPICLYSKFSMLSEMRGVSDYWRNRLEHYFRLEKDQTIESLSKSAEDILYSLKYELEFNIASQKTNEIKERIEKPNQPYVSDQRREDIANFQELLDIHRKTLVHYLKQQAMQGTAYVPPGVNHGIAESRKNIKYIKNSFLKWGVIVEDYPYDEEL